MDSLSAHVELDTAYLIHFSCIDRAVLLSLTVENCPYSIGFCSRLWAFRPPSRYRSVHLAFSFLTSICTHPGYCPMPYLSWYLLRRYAATRGERVLIRTMSAACPMRCFDRMLPPTVALCSSHRHPLEMITGSLKRLRMSSNTSINSMSTASYPQPHRQANSLRLKCLLR